MTAWCRPKALQIRRSHLKTATTQLVTICQLPDSCPTASECYMLLPNLTACASSAAQQNLPRATLAAQMLMQIDSGIPAGEDSEGIGGLDTATRCTNLSDLFKSRLYTHPGVQAGRSALASVALPHSHDCWHACTRRLHQPSAPRQRFRYKHTRTQGHSRRLL